MKIGNEEGRFRDGDVIYIPEKTSHSNINDGEQIVDFLAFGAFTKSNRINMKQYSREKWDKGRI
jgi:oxalate decarboxylase/phosphoglucose isomerase-like protein (cupin superfamily)